MPPTPNRATPAAKQHNAARLMLTCLPPATTPMTQEEQTHRRLTLELPGQATDSGYHQGRHRTLREIEVKKYISLICYIKRSFRLNGFLPDSIGSLLTVSKFHSRFRLQGLTQVLRIPHVYRTSNPETTGSPSSGIPELQLGNSLSSIRRHPRKSARNPRNGFPGVSCEILGLLRMKTI